MQKIPSGYVTLAGAGPGDPDLITLKAKRAIQKADVILYDYLVHPNLLNDAKPDALVICVGKRKGYHSKKQDEINQLMKEYAEAGNNVLRLKGGDPCLFGRSGEEMSFLKAHNIPYRLIPGVTSALAVPAYAGIPVTHRDYAKSVAIITASSKEGETLNDIHIPDAETLVFLMPMTPLADLCKRLSTHAKFTENTPAALLYRGTTADQKTLIGTLKNLPELRDQNAITPPAILVVGPVAKLAQELNWRDRLALFGQRIILLRTQEQSEKTIEMGTDLGAEIIAIPLLKIQPNTQENNAFPLSKLQAADTLIFTSANGVVEFKKWLFKHRQDTRITTKKIIIAIGPKTEEALADIGLIADKTPNKTKTSDDILDLFDIDLHKKNILLLTASGSRDVLETELQNRGATVTRFELYTTIPTTLPQSIDIRDGDWVFFTSASTVTHFFASNLYQNQKIKPVCIGIITQTALQEKFAGKVYLSAETTLESMFDAVRKST